MTDRERLTALREAVGKMTPGISIPDTPEMVYLVQHSSKGDDFFRVAEFVIADDAQGFVALRNSAEWLIGLAERALVVDALRLEAKAEALEEVWAQSVDPQSVRYYPDYGRYLWAQIVKLRAEAAKLREADRG